MLHAADPGRTAGFGFRWRGRRVRAELAADAQLRLSVLAGHVPFTAEAAALRPGVYAGLTPSHGVVIEAIEALDAPATASRLIAAAARFALRLGPCLDLLDEAGVRPA